MMETKEAVIYKSIIIVYGSIGEALMKIHLMRETEFCIDGVWGFTSNAQSYVYLLEAYHCWYL